MLARPSARRMGCGPPASRRAPRPAARGRGGRCPIGSAPPRPSSTTSTCRCALRSVTQTAARSAPLCLAALASASETTNQAAVSTACGRLARDVDGRRGRHGAAGGERDDRRPEAALGEQARAHAAREVAQLGERPLGLLARLADQLARALGVAVEALLGHAEVHRQRHEPRLGAVVQVALDPLQLGGRGVDRAGARLGQPLDAGGQRGPEQRRGRCGPARARAGAGGAARRAAARRRARPRRPPPPTCRS